MTEKTKQEELPKTGYGMRLYPKVDPKRAAFIIIDMQNDECHPNGWYARNGYDIGVPDDPRPTMARPIGPLRRVIPTIRKYKIPIIWTRHHFRHPYVDGGVLAKVRRYEKDMSVFHTGSWGVEIDDRLKEYVRPDEDWFVDKRRLSGFFQTDLELILRSLAAEYLVVTGVNTWMCVESTVRDAMFRDFKVVVLGDCTGGHTHLDLQEPTLKVMQQGFGDVLTSEQFLKELTENPSP